jgi:maleylpyruvate isomerase
VKLTLSSYWRSSSAWRVRIGLHWKGLPFEYRAVNLLEGAQFSGDHRARSAMNQVPVLEVEEGGRTARLSQSVAVLEWLEERFPARPLLPADPIGRARVRMIVEDVNSGIQPFQNASTLKWLRERLPGGDAPWIQRFLSAGMASLEEAVRDGAGRFCHGDEVTLADLYVVPQLYGARRFGLDVSSLPTLLRVEEACRALEPFARSEPDRQPDAPPPTR